MDCKNSGVVTLDVDGKKLTADRNVLVQSSGYFEAIFEPIHSGFIEKDSDHLTLQDMNWRTLNALLKCLPVNDQSDSDINAMAEKMTAEMLYICTRLIMKFNYEQVAIKSLSPKNCYSLYVAAEDVACKKLRITAYERMLFWFLRFRRTRNFKEMSLHDLMSYLSDRRLIYDFPKDILEAIIWWIRHDVDNRGKLYPDLVTLVDWPQVKPSQIKHVLRFPTINKCPPSFAALLKFLHYCGPEDTPEARIGRELLAKESRPPPPLVLLFRCQVFDKIEVKKKSCFVFFHMETKSFFGDKIITEKCPDGCAVTFYDGNLIICGGIHGIRTSNWNRNVMSYNIFTKEWKVLARLDIPRRHFGLARRGSELYLIGGTSRFRIPTSSVQKVDVKTVTDCDDLFLFGPINYPFGCCWHKNRLYLAQNSDDKNSVLTYREDIDLWQSWQPFRESFGPQFVSALSIGEQIYTITDELSIMKKSALHLRVESPCSFSSNINGIHYFNTMNNIQTTISFLEHDSKIYFCGLNKKRKFIMQFFDTVTENLILKTVQLRKFEKKLKRFIRPGLRLELIQEVQSVKIVAPDVGRS
ncbi:kelch-like protein 30 isoform X2 [Neocloeon triangulifer]|uniref:kelch-like protein 30 isoform X2 n=1 Tax=Neocloeon triangulifer TaxID=2078957 RepID=UPI00286F1DFB|nr:kelch-like protein 30 isoform X2 [Neocloeon triangulifer]